MLSYKAFRAGDYALMRDGQLIEVLDKLPGVSVNRKSAKPRLLVVIAGEEQEMKAGEFNRAVLVRVTDDAEKIRLESMLPAKRLEKYSDAVRLRNQVARDRENIMNPPALEAFDNA